MFIFISQTLQIAGADVGLLRRSGMLRLAVLAVALVPAIYALIYLSSVWDSNAKTGAFIAAMLRDAVPKRQARYWPSGCVRFVITRPTFPAAPAATARLENVPTPVTDRL